MRIAKVSLWFALGLLSVAPAALADNVQKPDSAEVPDSVMSAPLDSVGHDSVAADTAEVMDTVLFTPGGALADYSSVSDTTDRERRLIQKPMVGLFKSMVLPGWGQLGNHKYVKAVVYAGLEAWMIGGAIHYGRQASDWRQIYDDTPPELVNLRNDYHGLWRDRQDERNKYTWFAVIVAFVSMFDAYVDAHLSGFPRLDEKKGMSLQFGPAGEEILAAAVSYRF